MTPMEWLDMAAADAVRRDLPDARPVLEGLARAVSLLRAADWNEEASGVPEAAAPVAPPAR
jgi:hypothetical protein